MPPVFEKTETHAMRLYPVCNVSGERLFPRKIRHRTKHLSHEWHELLRMLYPCI